MAFGLNSGVSGNGEGAASIRSGFKKSRGTFGSGRQFNSLKDQMALETHRASLQDQLNANSQTYANQGATHAAELGDIRATRDTARSEYVKNTAVDRLNTFRTQNPETARYSHNDKGLDVSFAAMGKPQLKPQKDPNAPKQERMSVKKIQAKVDSGELSEAEAAGRWGHYAKKVGVERAKTNAGMKPADIRGGVSYVAGDKYDSGPRQFSNVTTPVK